MKWTKELPTVPGWYWRMTNNSYLIGVVQVTKRADGQIDYSGVPVDEFGGKWAGPIPEPTEESNDANRRA